MTITKEAEDIYEGIAAAYGSSSGILFGIPEKHKHAIIAIIQCTLDATEEEQHE